MNGMFVLHKGLWLCYNGSVGWKFYPVMQLKGEITMRTIAYKCDRCGKPVTSRVCVKINMTVQRGSEPSEKKTFDYCTKCMLAIKKAFAEACVMDDGEASGCVSEREERAAVVPEPSQGNAPAATETEEETRTEQDKLPHTESVQPADAPPDGVIQEEHMDGDGLRRGPISMQEKNEMLNMYVNQGMSADVIAEKLHRALKGVSRALNAARKDGTLDRLMKEKEKAAKEDAIEETMDYAGGSGASNTGILKDGYTAPPRSGTIGGRRYDIGGVMALANAGWDAGKIAEERHYDVDVVRLILEQYGKAGT